MYEITITKTTIEERPAGKEWKVVAQNQSVEHVGKMIDEYGYTPEIVKKQEVEVLVLKQNVEELDLPAVIKAVNNL